MLIVSISLSDLMSRLQIAMFMPQAIAF